MPNEYSDKKLGKLFPSFDFSNDLVKKTALSEDAHRGRGTSKTLVVGIVERNGNVIAKNLF